MLSARHYDPTNAIFISPDPVVGGGYQYGFWNPVANADPTGLWPCLSLGTGSCQDWDTPEPDWFSPDPDESNAPLGDDPSSDIFQAAIGEFMIAGSNSTMTPQQANKIAKDRQAFVDALLRGERPSSLLIGTTSL